MGIAKEFTKYKLNDKILKHYQKQLQNLAFQLLLTESKTYRHIAIQLHDNLGQTLSLCIIKLKELWEDNRFKRNYKNFLEIIELINKSIAYTRSLVSELAPPVLYTLGLEAAVASLIETFKEKNKIIFKTDEKPAPINTIIRDILYRAIRELLFNIYKHAKATNLEVSIQRKVNRLIVKVKDNGIGFNVSDVSNIGKNIGLISLKEQLKYIGGIVVIKSKIGYGTEVIINTPLKLIKMEKGRYANKSPCSRQP